MQPNNVKSSSFWIALLLIVAAVLIIIITWFGLYRILNEDIPHIFSWIGAGFIAIFLPTYAILKRRYPGRIKTLLPFHVFGNLISFVFISIHFSYQVSQVPRIYPELGTGIALYAAVLIMVISGFVIRFRLAKKGWKSWLWLHRGIMLSFYLIIIVHILHVLEML